MGSWSHDCSSSAGLLDSYPALVLYLAGVALHQQPMGSRSHDCSSYVGCGGIPCSILVSPNASLHKWQQAVAPGWLPYMVPQNWIQARTKLLTTWLKINLIDRLIRWLKVKPKYLALFSRMSMILLIEAQQWHYCISNRAIIWLGTRHFSSFVGTIMMIALL